VHYRAARVAILALLSCAAIAAYAHLVTHDPVAGFAKEVPGTSGRPAEATGGSRAATLLPTQFQAFTGSPSAVTASWPRFRGASFDNTVHDGATLVTPGPGWSPPAPSWTIALGEGHAGAAVANGRVYILDYDEALQSTMLRCFSFDTGAELWRRWYSEPLKRNHGVSRTVPAVSGRYVVTLDPACSFMCCDALTGAFLWRKDLPAEFGGEVPLWYTGQCPLIDGNEAVIAVGGSSVLLAGFDLASGRQAWTTPTLPGVTASHSSIMVMTVAGVRQYVYAAIGAIVGLSAEPGDRGRLLWKSTEFDAATLAPSPVDAGADRVFVAAGYGTGSILLQVQRDGSAFSVRTLAKGRPGDILSCEQQSPVRWGGLLFGVLPDSAGADRGQLACWDPATRAYAWTSGPENRFGQYGPFLVADNKLFVLSDSGVLTVVRASTTGYEPLGSARILQGPDSWGPMALVDGRLIARDSLEMVCIDLRARR
jgi:outer membrane protein assembly factor BamB